MNFERLEVAFQYHQGHDWKRYTRFFADLQLGFDFMVLYDDPDRTELGDPDTSGHSVLDAHLGDGLYSKLIHRWPTQTRAFRNEERSRPTCRDRRALFTIRVVVEDHEVEAQMGILRPLAETHKVLPVTTLVIINSLSRLVRGPSRLQCVRRT
ncbi:BQ5605_C023g09671 [Microbotryum silenes-dioicae]|uniref:BQ5605_C023g09671 protein n=1 Tax=Microbotryum silenes-dioicae TaxID=796604 RepID=A0A2X0MQ11_9BASI|nr:BQ5605_C023g09671 [Microbotryum silenes-dioicae]